MSSGIIEQVQVLKIQEVIVVEGKDDADRIKQAVDADIIITHGFGIKESTFKRIEEAQKRCGVIVLTDPDHAGEQIRKRICDRVPGVKNAYIPRLAATLEGDIGVENASPEAILKALSTLRTERTTMGNFTMPMLYAYGLVGEGAAKALRAKVGAALGIGYGNAKQLLQRLNHYGITLDELEEAMVVRDRD